MLTSVRFVVELRNWKCRSTDAEPPDMELYYRVGLNVQVCLFLQAVDVRKHEYDFMADSITQLHPHKNCLFQVEYPDGSRSERKLMDRDIKQITSDMCRLETNVVLHTKTRKSWTHSAKVGIYIIAAYVLGDPGSPKIPNYALFLAVRRTFAPLICYYICTCTYKLLIY